MRPHPFFYAFLVALVLGFVASLFAGSAAPAYALHSNIVYRAEIGGVVLALGYAVSIIGWLAWHGRALRVELGPATIDPADATGVDRAASGFEDFRDDVYDQINDLSSVVDALRKDLEGLGNGQSG